MVTIPRLVVAAPASGQGKTSIATGLLAALRRRGEEVSPHKVGPDYIDPGYHALASGRPGRNLDPWLVGEGRIVELFRHAATTPRPAGIAVIEGVMGLFDGARGAGDFASTAHVAKLLSAPVALVVDASGAARSVAALLHGFASFDPGLRIGGVIFNKVGSAGHAAMLAEAAESVGIPVLGAVPRDGALAVDSRHLGLIPALERTAEAVAVVEALGDAVARCVDLDAVMALARTAPPLPAAGADRGDGTDQGNGPAAFDSALTTVEPARIAVAGGPAFTFSYAEHTEMLARAGAEAVAFDPLRDEALPPEVDGLIIGGGFPQIHAEQLSGNAPLRARVAALAAQGAPIVAECAGLLYLGAELDGHPMCGVLPARARMTSRLTLGYRDAVAAADSVLARRGERFHGHEFHRTATDIDPAAAPAWTWRGPDGRIDEGVAQGAIHASYLHLHWAGSPQLPIRLAGAARAARERRRNEPRR